MRRFFEILFTPAVRAAQSRLGSPFAGHDVPGPALDARLGPNEAEFLAARDSFFLSSVSSDGWPYIQHRGGPAGFVRVLDADTIAWAEFSGNRQYLTLGNVAGDDRVALFVLDHAARRRLKLIGHLAFHEARERPDLVEAVSVAPYRARIERVAVLRVAGFDWNCPQHITPRFTGAEIAAAMQASRGEALA